MKVKHAAALLSALAIMGGTAWTQSPGFVDATKLDGQDVYDFHGKKLGDLKQVLVDPATGRTRYAVMEVDKAWNINDPSIAVPWGAFKINRKSEKEWEFSLDVTKEKLENAPKFKMGEADRLYTREGGTPIYKYWEIWWLEEPAPPPGKP